MKSFAEIDIENNGNYLKLLSAVSKLSGLFSESAIPYINYRVAENLFCKCFDAKNLSRSDTAFDAEINSVGIGLKTFTCNSNISNEKIAEFNSLSRILNDYKGLDLAIKLSEFRNERINLANRLYNIDKSIYHIVARKEKELLLFETDYEVIDISKIKSVKSTKSSLQFEDGKNSYNYNFSKSTLFRKFLIPENAYRLPIEIIEDPYSLLLDIFKEKELISSKTNLQKGINYVVLPLYGLQKGTKEKFVFTRSGLNQWNSAGRPRNNPEMYIPIPIKIHELYPNFFPRKDVKFNLKTPTNEILNAKVCQSKNKALMTNPNHALSDWLLRKVLKLKEGELATVEKLNELGFDSVIIIKEDEQNYKIDILKTDSYEQFIS